MAAYFCLSCSVPSEELAMGTGYGVSATGLGGGEWGESCRAREQVVSAKTVSLFRSAPQPLMSCKAPEELVIVEVGDVCISERAWGWRPFPTVSNLVQDFFLIENFKVTIKGEKERRGGSYFSRS